ncbi:DUF309 domain-containing protein [Brevibacillus borstelensis]|jgi:hypothetical protein|uniref:DUF309 domain-containing protein n=1 Tax=Brevibacillus borstelensis TaxID=45462 RepID=UPI0004694E1C|nr:DUF309 domain-containing protein [Brevibacillus borstelensis]MCM3622711.1 DUF309 domain-containing protein [Brevibacillus borstelensis]
MYPQPYLEYLIQFHAERDYFECHEILEEYWKESPPGERRAVWVGLIQVAVSLYHQRRGNFAGAIKMMDSAIKILNRERTDVQSLGLDPDATLQTLSQLLAEMKQNSPYHSIRLPIADPALLADCRKRCEERGLHFDSESDLFNTFLLHKHTQRDRSDVIAERLRRLDERSQRRSGSTDADK